MFAFIYCISDLQFIQFHAIYYYNFHNIGTKENYYFRKNKNIDLK